jgi:hypothetical protein
MSNRSVHFYNHYISRLFNTDLHLFEFSVWLQAFAQALISVFIPIILWQLGLSLKEIVVFYLLFNFLDVPLNIVARNLIQKYGARTVVILAIISELVYLVLLYNLSDNWIVIFFLALFLAIYDSFYWVAHLYIFSSAAHKSNLIRNDVSTLKNFRILGALVAPLVGVFIITKADSNTLIFFSTLIMFASLLPLFRMRHLKFVPETKALPLKEFFRSEEEKTNYLFISLAAIRQEAEDVIWPFFIFFTFNSIRNAAFVPVIVALVNLLLIRLVGKLSVKRSVYRLISIGAAGLYLVWISRMFLYQYQFFAIGSVALVTLLATLVEIPLEVSIFRRAHETDHLAAVTYMNMFRMLARGIFYLLLFIFGTYFTGAFYIVMMVLFILAVSAKILKLKHKTT